MKFPHTERFGIGFGFKKEAENNILMTLWPRQEHNSPVFTSIQIEDLGAFFPLIQDAKEKHEIQGNFGIVAWIHTHPHMSLFLSGTDRETIKNWSELIDGVVAIVFNVFGRRDEIWRTFAPDNEVLSSRLDTHLAEKKLEPFFKQLCRDIPRRMSDIGRPIEALFTPFASYSNATLGLNLDDTIDPQLAEERSSSKAFPLSKKISGDLHMLVKFLRKKTALRAAEGVSIASGTLIPPVQGRNDQNELKRRLERYDDWFIPAVPAVEISISMGEKLPEELKRPLIKSEFGEILGFQSGICSAILFPKSKDFQNFRLKGCGFGNNGFVTEVSLYANGGRYQELRGAQFENTCQREQHMNRIVNQRLEAYKIPAANIPLGWWRYECPWPAKPFCGLFLTSGEFRLRDDLLFSIESALPRLLMNPIKIPASLEIIGGKPSYQFLLEQRSPLSLVNWELFPDIDELENKYYEDAHANATNIELGRFLRADPPNITNLYWTLGVQAGKIKKILEDANIIWGTYFDKRNNVWHCNSHADNFVLVSNEDGASISILDFDLSFDRGSFVNIVGRDHSFDSLLKMENWWLQLDLAGYTANSFPPVKEIKLDYPWSVIRNGLRETLITGYLKGYKEGQYAMLSPGMLSLICYCLMNQKS